jgi:hypothetical protein
MHKLKGWVVTGRVQLIVTNITPGMGDLPHFSLFSRLIPRYTVK